MIDDKKYYATCHAYINRKYGKANKCNHCMKLDKKRYEYALIKGKEYSKNIEDYTQLCTSCHRLYDYTQETKKKMSLTRKDRKVPNFTGKKHFKSIPIIRTNLKDVFIDEWESINQCAIHTNIKKQNILECLKGNIYQIKGYKFKKKPL